MSFWRELPKTTLRAIFTSSPTTWVRQTFVKRASAGPRLTQYALAITELSWGFTFLFLVIMAWIFSRQVQWTAAFATWLGGNDGDGTLVYLLSDNRLRGVLFGWVFGFLSVLVSRRVWVPLILTEWALMSGVLGLNVGWGVWLGVLPGFWLLQTIRSPKGDFKKWLWFKTALSFLTFLVVFIFSDELTNFIRVAWVDADALQLRTVQWCVSGVITLCFGLALSAVYFHIYFWLFYRKR